MLVSPFPGLYTNERPIILASGSPRRRELLLNLGLNFDVVPSQMDEPAAQPGESPAAYAERMSELKAQDVADAHADQVVIGSDTVVAVDGHILGKPADSEDALRMLRLLSGKVHEVVSGVCLVLPAPARQTITLHASTAVTMRSSTDAELRAYIATGEPSDKAGAYAIQGIGTFMVTEISGSYTNVVGLPVARVLEVLVSWGVIVPRQG